MSGSPLQEFCLEGSPMNESPTVVSPSIQPRISPPPAKNSPSGLVRWLKFNAVGAIGIAVQLAALTLLKSGLGLNYLLATALAVEVTVLHNFFWHERFTWSDRPTTDRLKRLLKFNLTTGLFSIAGNVAFTHLLVSTGIAYLPANAISIALCSIINFALNDRLVFAGPAN
jgi:putative flippase GtrA